MSGSRNDPFYSAIPFVFAGASAFLRSTTPPTRAGRWNEKGNGISRGSMRLGMGLPPGVFCMFCFFFPLFLLDLSVDKRIPIGEGGGVDCGS